MDKSINHINIVKNLINSLREAYEIIDDNYIEIDTFKKRHGILEEIDTMIKHKEDKG